jgi:hypothetical protein
LQAIGSSKLLAREAIIRHLQLMNHKHKHCHQRHEQHIHADVALHVLRGNVFEYNAEWSKLLGDTRPAFVMTNPGWFHVDLPLAKLLTHAMMHELHRVR